NLAGFGQFIDRGLDEVLELRVRQLGHLTAQQAEPGASELVFLLRRDNGRTGVAQRGQVVGMARYGEQAGQRQQGGSQKIHPWSSELETPYCSWLNGLLTRVRYSLCPA